MPFFVVQFQNTETHSEPSQTSKVKFFAKIDQTPSKMFVWVVSVPLVTLKDLHLHMVALAELQAAFFSKL